MIRKKYLHIIILCLILFLYFIINHTVIGNNLNQTYNLYQASKKINITVPKTANLLLYVNTFSEWSNEGTIYFVFSLTEENIEQIRTQKNVQAFWSPLPISDYFRPYMYSRIANDTMYEIYHQTIPFSSSSGYFTLINDTDNAVLNIMSKQSFTGYKQINKNITHIRIGFLDTTEKKLYLLIKHY